MNLSSPIRASLLAGVGLSGLVATTAFASEAEPQAAPVATAPSGQPQPEPETEFGSGPGEIVVSAARRRGQLDVEQAPLLELNEQDIAAEGVTSIAELIAQITNQTGSSRGRGGGGQPVILINGIRVGSFREFSNYPPEALDRVEVFPEEVAQRFGFPPDRRVVNLILKENYNSTEVELEFEGPDRGGSYTREQELGYLTIANGARINANLTLQDTSMLTEDERDIIQTPGSISDVAGDPDQAQYRSLIADSRSIEANLSYAKAFTESGISISANAGYTRNDRRSLQGLNTVILTDDPADPDAAVLRTFGEETPLTFTTASDTLSTSGSLTMPVNAFRLTSTFDASLVENTQTRDLRFDTQAFEDAALAGTLALDGPLPSSADGGASVAFSRTLSASSLTTLRGPVADLPGGELLTTFDVGYSWVNLESTDTRDPTITDLTRGNLSTGVNVVIPITSRRNGFADALGSFTLTGQIGLDRLSDFGTLGDYTVSLNWAPFDNLELSASYIVREVAPGLGALGNPQVVNENVSVFDFTTGETVLVDVTTGGNPDLLAETQRDWKFAANWEVPFIEGARLTAEYIRNRSDDVTSSFPTLTPEIEAAFPDRVTRDDDGQLVALDRRAVTYAETRNDRLTFGLQLRGSIGAGEGGRGGGFGGGGGRGGPPAQAAQPAQATGAPSGGPGSFGPAQMAAFQSLRTVICGDDGLANFTRLAEAAARGDSLAEVIPGFDGTAVAPMFARINGADGAVNPERLAAARERICSFDPSSAMPGQRPGGPPGGGGGGGGFFQSEAFASLRALACAEDGSERLAALIARIDAGEDVSDVLPGLDTGMLQGFLGRLRAQDGTIDKERLEGLRSQLCAAPGGAQGGPPAGAGGGAGGGGGGFNPLSRDQFRGFRYFLSLNHTIELKDEILIAPGLDVIDQLNGQATSAFGVPRHSTRLEAGLFGGGIGVRASARYVGSTRLDGAEGTGTGSLFVDDLATFDLRLFTEVGQLLGRNEGALQNLRVSFRVDNIFDARRNVVDENGETPLNYQPFLIDPVGRYIGVDIRKLF